MRIWSTDDVPTRESFSYWNDAVCDAFLRVRTEREQRDAFQGRIESLAAGPVLINRVVSERHVVRRGPQALGEEWFFLNLHTAGACALSQAGRDHRVAAGDLTLHDSTRAFDLRFPTAMALTCFVIPRAALTARSVDAPSRVASPLPAVGVGSLLRGFVSTYAAALPSLSTAAIEQGATMLVDLLALTLGPNSTGQAMGHASAQRALFDRICARVRLQLGDPALDLATTARRAGLAPRTLQTLFQRHRTSFTSYVQEQRLLAAKRQLQETGASITEIAYAVGFQDLSHFSRSFRRTFGVSAREWRSQTPSPRPGPGGA